MTHKPPLCHCTTESDLEHTFFSNQVLVKKCRKKSIFSLDQGQGSIFNFRRCAQSISRMILPLKIQRFCHTTVFLKSTVFLKHPVFSLNQGQGSVFTVRECVQSIFRMILSLEKSGPYIVSQNLFDLKNFFSIFREYVINFTPLLSFCPNFRKKHKED